MEERREREGEKENTGVAPLVVVSGNDGDSSSCWPLL